MTQSATFLPPVLAVGSDASQNGRNRLGSGLVTHRGILDANSLRATGVLYPQSGAGLELAYQQTPAYPTKKGVLQSFDRDAGVYTDLQIVGQNITLSALSGGKVALPAGTAQALIGQYAGSSSWGPPAAAAWYESDARCSFTATGGLLRVEYNCAVTSSTGGSATAATVGIGLDGASPALSLNAVHIPQASNAMPCAGVMYLSGVAAGLHRASIFLYMTGSPALTFHNWAHQVIWVTEQRA